MDQIEQSLTKRFKSDIWRKFIRGINKYQMLKEGDKVGVCISGGKDSMLMALCFKHLHKYSKFKFDVEYIVMDPGYKKENRELIVSNASKLGIDVKTANGILRLIKVKPEGKGEMFARDWGNGLRG